MTVRMSSFIPSRFPRPQPSVRITLCTELPRERHDLAAPGGQNRSERSPDTDTPDRIAPHRKRPYVTLMSCEAVDFQGEP